MLNWKKRARALLLVFSLTAAGFAVQAKTHISHDYILDEDGRHVAIPRTHECAQVIDLIQGYEPAQGDAGRLNNPQDIFVDRQDNIYIVDTGNNALVKLDPTGRLLQVITEADGKPLNYPLGVYVDEDGDIFLADNGNQRILHLDSQGGYIETFVAPQSELLSQNLTTFDPSKVAVNSYNGYIYMLIGKEFLTLDALNRFQGLVGTDKVGFDFIDFIVRTFATDLQKSKLKKREPVSYNNFCISPDNQIYAVSMAQSNQIKKISAIGDSTYPAGNYGEVQYDSAGTPTYPFLVDIAVNSYGMITVADQHSSRLYQYSDDGELLAVFGGAGDNKANFSTISSICYDTKDRLFVLDSTAGNIQVLEPTAFLQRVHMATSLYLEGKYEASLAEWNRMRQLVSSYPVAQTSVANILYKQGHYDQALDEYYQAGDKAGYGKTMGALRKAFCSTYFAPVAVGLIGGVILLVWLVLRLRRRSLVTEASLYSRNISRPREFGGLCLLSFYHPVRALDLIKWRRPRVNLLPIIVLPVLLIAVRTAASYFTGFTVSSMKPEDVSLAYEALMVLLPYVTLGFCLYGITSVFSGETTLYETFASLAYSLVPMIVLWPLLTIVSLAVSDIEAALFLCLRSAVYVWVAWNVVLSVNRLNDISARRTVGLCALSVLGVAIVWVVCMLLFTFTAQLFYFGNEVYREISGRLL